MVADCFQKLECWIFEVGSDEATTNTFSTAVFMFEEYLEEYEMPRQAAFAKTEIFPLARVLPKFYGPNMLLPGHYCSFIPAFRRCTVLLIEIRLKYMLLIHPFIFIRYRKTLHTQVVDPFKYYTL